MWALSRFWRGRPKYRGRHKYMEAVRITDATIMNIWVVAAGLVTIYSSVHGGALKCDDGRGLIYSEDLPPFVAVDYREYESGNIFCGDKLLIIGDGWELEARAWDSGYLYRYYIEDYGPDVKIIADIPQFLAPFSGMCAEAVVINLSALERERLWKVVD
jgi:hypothetical protein